MLKDVHKILTELAATASTLEKEDIIRREAGNVLFKRVLVYALASDKTYHIRKMQPRVKLFAKRVSSDKLFEFLDYLDSKDGANTHDIKTLTAYASADEETYDVVTRIVNKDLKCGVGVKTVNNVFPGLIFHAPYCRCSSDSKEDKFWKKPGKKIAQLKENGMFFNCSTGQFSGFEFLSRDGKLIHQLDFIKKILCDNVTSYRIPTAFHNTTFMGEMLIVRDGKILDRQTGNGILNKLIHGTAPQHEANSIVLRIWDIIPTKDFWEGECSIPYDKRLARTEELCSYYKDFVVDGVQALSVVYYEYVENKEQAADFYKRMRDLNEEGAVLKWAKALWKDHTSPDQVKKKNVSDCDLRLIGWKAGKKGTKYEDTMGALFFESSCGKLQVTINGKTDEMRDLPYDEMLGSIWKVLFESISYAKKKDTASLYLPRLEENFPRKDKLEADSLDDILKKVGK